MKKTYSSLPQGTETILVAEDFDSARELVVDSLQVLGYKVLAAENGAQAISLMKKHPGKIDLLLADIIIPDINGKELYDKLAEYQPGLKILFMSGYTDEVIINQDTLTNGVNFLQKPFSLIALTSKIRNILDGTTGE